MSGDAFESIGFGTSTADMGEVVVSGEGGSVHATVVVEDVKTFAGDETVFVVDEMPVEVSADVAGIDAGTETAASDPQAANRSVPAIINFWR